MLGGACCNTCIIGSDAFTANDGRPHTGWTNRPAIYSTAGGDEAENSGGSFNFAKPNVQKFNTPNPEGASSPTAVYTKFYLTEAVAGDGVSFIVPIGYLDDDNYLFARVDYFSTADTCVVNGGDGSTDSGQITLYKRVAGVETALLTAEGFPCYSRIKGLTLATWHEIWVCHIPNNYGTYGDGDTIRARVKLNGVTDHNPGCQGVADGFTGGAYCGLGNRLFSTTHYGVVKFDDFKYSYFRGTDHLSCPNCNGPCPIFSDTFAYDDTELDVSNNLNCLWATIDSTEADVAGAARFLSGQLEIESGCAVKCRVGHPTAKSSKILTVSFLWEASVLIKINTGSGYAILDSTPAIRQIRIYDNDGNLLPGGSSDLLALPAADDAVHTAEVCLERGVVTVTMDGACENAEAPDTGDPFVYLGSDGGTVHFTGFAFTKYKDSSEPKDGGCEICGCDTTCSPCCTDPDPYPSYLLDLGAGGWTAKGTGACECTGCADVLGEYIVSSEGGTCPWYYRDDTCDLPLCCPLCGGISLRITLSLASDMTGCRWKVIVEVGVFFTHDPSCPCGDVSATYYSDYLTDTTKCRTLPVALTRDSEAEHVDSLCTGSLPATITLEAA